MVEKITKEERKVSLAIEKAKEVIQAFQDGTTVEMEGDLQGEEVKLKSPKKNPAEEKVVNPVGKEEGYGYVKVKKAEIIVKEILTDLIKISKSRGISSGKWFNVLKILSKTDGGTWDSRRNYSDIGLDDNMEANPVFDEDMEELQDENLDNLEAQVLVLEDDLRRLLDENTDGRNDDAARAVNAQISNLDRQISELRKAVTILTKLFK